ncbi:hypothetical protein N658DRAFT_558607 [Parathielavia hyrcaniae]|uniref:Uncharacterized protein n=1 Tax=Parathielavia hyrcaniae TaxID=113614 RepID=A0AAN6Q1Q2_9PEZI|nr:hypothetical protein N658DRAFT_558607 [Parathielavia hyrcaniae]
MGLIDRKASDKTTTWGQLWRFIFPHDEMIPSPTQLRTTQAIAMEEDELDDKLRQTIRRALKSFEYNRIQGHEEDVAPERPPGCQWQSLSLALIMPELAPGRPRRHGGPQRAADGGEPGGTVPRQTSTMVVDAPLVQDVESGVVRPNLWFIAEELVLLDGHQLTAEQIIAA